MSGERWVRLLLNVADNAFDQWEQELPPPTCMQRFSDAEIRCAQELCNRMRQGFPALDVRVDTHDYLAPFVDVVSRVRRMPSLNEVQNFWEKDRRVKGDAQSSKNEFLHTFFSELSLRRVGNGYIMNYTPRRLDGELFWKFGGRSMPLHADMEQVQGFPFPRSPLATCDESAGSSTTHIVATVHTSSVTRTSGKIIARQILCLEDLEKQTHEFNF